MSVLFSLLTSLIASHGFITNIAVYRFKICIN
jgi:hypothetical protein